ncbi:MAG: hypothetical protein KatS3mg018_0615 [Fimbriimonadales bacterium]|nr:MAG: hypothetical protein KatS3mg018_0615 [Fimbriimonadales bacterium]
MVDEWQRLCVKLQIVGRRAHDARLIAYMRGHGLDKLFTLNVSDFQAFTADGIQLI